MHINETPSGELLLKLLMDDIRKRLVDQAIETIRPSIEAAAKQALAELKPKVLQQYDIAADRLAFDLVFGERKADASR